jgi:hypothetical protein
MLKNKTEVYSVDEWKLLRAGIVPQKDKGNRKIKNATKISSGGVSFDSKLEKAMYDKLTLLGVRFEFKKKFVIIPGFVYLDKKVREITWTPDFFFPDIELVLDTKGFPDAKFPIKLKLFKMYCIQHNTPYAIWIVKDKHQVDAAAFSIKECVDNQTNVKFISTFSV